MSRRVQPYYQNYLESTLMCSNRFLVQDSKAEQVSVCSQQRSRESSESLLHQKGLANHDSNSLLYNLRRAGDQECISQRHLLRSLRLGRKSTTHYPCRE
ncbi:hypothetical protein SLE2022_398190 [Rubroshorea leprosula]